MKKDSAAEQNPKHVAVDFVAGAIGATTSVYVGQPLDTLKVKMQTFPKLYPNLGICFRETFRKEGIVRGLYAGTVPSLAANVAENSILFASYGVCQTFVANVFGVNKVENLSTFQNGTSGSLAAFFAALALCPTELVKCRMQAMREQYLQKGQEPPRVGPFKLTAQIVKADGVGGLFRGLTPTFMREMPGYFCFFYAYELTREALKPPGGTKEDVGILGTMFAGGMAGVTLWSVIFPADVIKSRLQVSGSKDPMIRTGLNIVRQEGALALYNGLLPTLLRTFPATGALFIAYETSRELMRNYV